MLQRLAAMTGPLRGQLAASARLRFGLMAIVAIVWIYGLLLAADEVTALEKQLVALNEQAARLKQLTSDREWPARADESASQLAALKAMVWVDSDLGVVEATFQDWARATANAAGLRLRELVVSRPANAAAPAASSGNAPGDGPQVIKARLVTDLDRAALLGFLSEAANLDRAVVVDHLLLRTWTQPPSAEIDLRILARARGVAAK